MIKNTLFSKWLYLLLFLSIGVVFLAYQYAVPYSIDVGGIRADDELFIGGFYQRETTADDDYRWTRGQASIDIPGIGLGRSWNLHVHLSGYRPSEEPPRVRLKVNGQDLPDFIAEGGMVEYQFPIETSMIGWDGNLVFEIQTEVFSPEGDLRELGLLVTRLTLVPDGGGVVIPAPLSLFLIVASTLVLFLFLRWMGASDKLSLAASVPLLLAFSFVTALHRQYVTWYSFFILILLAGASFGALCLQALLKSLAQRWGWSILEQDKLKPLLGILFLALACNLALSPTPGFVGDIGIYMTWAWKLTTNGVHSAYLPHDLVEPINYLPFVPYLFSLVGWLYQRLFASTFPFPLQESSLLLYSMMKLPMIMANIATGALIFLFVRKNVSFRLALVALTAYLFNPAILFDSAYGGQADAIHSLFALLAIILLLNKRLAAAWLGIALAALSKPQGALFLPLILFLTWREFGVRAVLKGMLVASLVVLMVFFPFLYRGTWDSLQDYLLSIGRLDIPGLPAYTTMGAHNLWWVLGLGAEVEDMVGPSSPLPGIGRFITLRTVGLSLLAFFYVLTLLKLWNNADKRSVPMLAAFVGFACYMSLTQVHETYAFSVLPLLALVFPSDKRLTIIYLALAITFFANMFLHDAAILDLLGLLKHERLVDALRYLNAITNLGVLVYWTVLVIITWKPDQVSITESHRLREAV